MILERNLALLPKLVNAQREEYVILKIRCTHALYFYRVEVMLNMEGFLSVWTTGQIQHSVPLNLFTPIHKHRYSYNSVHSNFYSFRQKTRIQKVLDCC
jgi:hypothetical protein